MPGLTHLQSCRRRLVIQLDLKGKTALVCGASQGIGAATAVELAALNARVILLARDEDRLEEVRSGLKNKDLHKVIVCDLVDTDALKIRIDKVLQEVGTIHILVCNAGGPKAGPALTATSEEFLQAFKIHVLAAHKLVQMVVPGMKDAGYGRIINVISTSVKAPLPNLGVSNTIRAAVANLAKTLAMEVGPFGITVNNVLPGYTRTHRLESLLRSTAERTGMAFEKVEESWRNLVPLKRFADPEETAQAIAFLASPAAGYISGVNLPVDGGRTNSL